jgi:hypothetical protein
MPPRLLLAASFLAAVLAFPAQAQDARQIDATDAATYRYSPATVDDVRSVAFPNHAFVRLLSQPGAAGIRAEFSAYPGTGLNTLMLQAVDSAGRSRTTGEVVNLANPCPPTCGSDAIDLAKLLAQLLMQGAGGRVLSADEVQAYREATAAKRAQQPEWFQTPAAGAPRKVFTQLLNQPGTIGLNFKFVRDADGRDTLLINAIDTDGRDFGAIFVAVPGR